MGELGTFLSAITPSGAAALHLALGGLRYDAELYPLPITKPSAPCPEWLRIELEAVRFKDVPLRREVIRQLVEMLAPGPSRPDGLPAYVSHVWRLNGHRTKTGRRGGIARRVAAAVACDLGDHDLIEVSAKVLGLRDHELPNAAMPGRWPHGEPNKARKYRRFGRQLLALLGVWPWTHAELGKLPKTWRTDAAFLEPLYAWHERACGEREQELARCWWASREGRHLNRSDLRELAPEGATHPVKPKQPGRKSERPDARDTSEQEEGTRVLAALCDELAERLDAREQARVARRLV